MPTYQYRVTARATGNSPICILAPSVVAVDHAWGVPWNRTDAYQQSRAYAMRRMAEPVAAIRWAVWP